MPKYLRNIGDITLQISLMSSKYSSGGSSEQIFTEFEGVEKPGGVIEADARTPVEELEKLLGLVLLDEDREEDIDTLSGLVSTLAGRVPSRGELISHPAGIEFEVADADPRRVKRLRIRRTTPPAPVD